MNCIYAAYLTMWPDNVCAHNLTILTVKNGLISISADVVEGVWVLIHNKSSHICMYIFIYSIFCKHLFADLVECLWAAVRVAEFHVNGVVEQSQAAARLQDSVDFLEKAWPVKPVEGRHGCQQVHWAVSKWQLLSHTLSKDGTITEMCSEHMNIQHTWRWSRTQYKG